MGKDYTAYKAEQLLNDDFFLDAELRPTVESTLFWENLQKEHKSLACEIDTARHILQGIRNNKTDVPLTQQEEEQLWTQIDAQNAQLRTKNKYMYIFKITAAAAAVIGLLFVGNRYIQQEEKPETDYLTIIQSASQVDDATQNVQLVLSNNQKLSIDGEEARLEYKKEGLANINSQKVDVTPEKEEKETQTFNQLLVPIGKRSAITFADGTQVWVNAGSKVIYPVKFGKDKREIFVEGEIFLQVSHDEKKPFIVKTRQMDITVLGTQFNVSAYENEVSQRVVLVDGKVEVKVQGKEKDVLVPDQMFSFNSKTNNSEIRQVDVDDYVAWKDGYYQFNHQPLHVILKKLARYYGLPIHWEKEAGELSCSGKLDLKDDLNEVLHTLKRATPIEIENNQESIHIKVKH